MALTLPHTPATPAQLLAAANSILPRSAALLAAAQWCFETAGGKSMYGWNPGALTCAAAPSFPCGRNPLVTSDLSFASFPSLAVGANGYLDYLQTYPKGNPTTAYASLLSGDLDTFSAALERLGYEGSAVVASTYASQLGGWLPNLSKIVLPPGPSTWSPTGKAVAVFSAAIVGVFFGTWAAEGFRR